MLSIWTVFMHFSCNMVEPIYNTPGYLELCISNNENISLKATFSGALYGHIKLHLACCTFSILNDAQCHAPAKLISLGASISLALLQVTPFTYSETCFNALRVTQLVIRIIYSSSYYIQCGWVRPRGPYLESNLRWVQSLCAESW